MGGNWARAKQFVTRNRGLITFASLGDIIIQDGLIDRALDRAGSAGIFPFVATLIECPMQRFECCSADADADRLRLSLFER